MPNAPRQLAAFARLGYTAKAVLYATIGILAARAAIGAGGVTTDTRGAMAAVLDAPFGRLLLVVIALGLAGYAGWRILEAIVDPEERGSDATGLALRAGFLGRGVVHAALAYSAIRYAIVAHSSSGSGQRTKEATSTAFRLTGGEWLVWAAGLGVIAYGVYQLYRALSAKLSDQLATGDAAAEVGVWIIAVSRFGIAARGIVFIAIGWLLLRAATLHDPNRAGGIGDALQSLQRLGRWPFAAIAVGLVAYAVYEMLNARYRRIQVR